MSGHILVVEDDFDISNMLRIYFSGQGYDVQVAPRGGDALSYTRKQLPHLIVLDIMLPGLDGLAVCRLVRKDPDIAHIPIIILTTTDDIHEINRCYELGCNVYITKPVDLDRDIPIFAKYLRRERRTPVLQ